MIRAIALCLLIVACGRPATTSHGVDRQDGTGAADPAAVAMVDAGGTASAHGFNYTRDREQPYR